jgi:methionine sulfoxide reductase heme-binding subunit
LWCRRAPSAARSGLARAYSHAVEHSGDDASLRSGKLQVIWPWQDRNGGFSWLKAGFFALMFTPGIWLVYEYEAGEFGPVPLGGVTYWSGLWATALLLLALAITPAMTILRFTRLLPVRRMIGVSALAYTIAHIIIYFALRFWNFASIAHEMATRISLIVATLATFGLIALGTTSLDMAVRRMGPRWQQLHNTVYVVTGLALVHYLLSPGSFPDQALTCGMFFWLVVWRIMDRSGSGTEPGTLAALAIAACLFTALLEAGWDWAYHDDDPLWVLNNNFSLVLGIAPAWKVLVLGLAIALGAALRQVPRRKGGFVSGVGGKIGKIG